MAVTGLRGEPLVGSLPGLVSAEDLTSHNRCFGYIVAGGVTVAHGAASSSKIMGIICEGTAAGAPVDLDMRVGIPVQMVVDGNAGAIAAGDWLTSDALGKGVKATPGNGVVVGAMALEASTAAGDVICVVPCHFMYQLS